MGSNKASAAILGIFLALGLAAAGWFVAAAAKDIKGAQRVVEVKGLAEREVPANLALWSLAFSTTADDLDTLQQRLNEDVAAIQAFLAQRGFAPEAITRGPPNIIDRATYANQKVDERYEAQSVVLVRTDKVELVKAAQQESNALIGQGVTLNRNYEYPTEYLFTELNRIKPKMIAQATRAARKAAEQFALDSGSTVGAIRYARQGYFSISDRDRLSPHIKRVRVVTTVEYFLVD